MTWVVTEGGVNSQLYKRDLGKTVQGKIGRDEEKSSWSLGRFPNGHTITGIVTVERKLSDNIMV